MESLSVIKRISRGSYTYSLMGYDNKPSFVHIDNHHTKNETVMVPVEALREILNAGLH